MKTFCIFLLATVGSTVTAFDLGERELQTCSTPNSNIACTLEEDPVKCGLNACPYSNLCVAGAAGYTPSRCYPSTCKAPAPDTVCTLESTPVLCGDSRCPYDNYCQAGAAGFPPTTCILQSCPTPNQSSSTCTAEYDPVACLDGGICLYDNGCLATLSGFNPDPVAGQCVFVTDVPANLPSCPVVRDGQVCAFDFDPVVCGADRCFYSNTCESQAAGFAAEDCQNANCPAPAAGTACTADFAPVLCGNYNCRYSNQCGATAAGFLESECSLESCASADPTNCPRDYKPTQCGGDGCIYDNDCLAQSAGFDPTPTVGECKPLLDGVNPATCPAPGGAACSTEVNEMQCGPFGCFYSNPCVANSAGYTDAECWEAYCPAPSTVDACDKVVDQITCGPYDCLYGNRCLANRAGFAPAECKPVSCPASDPNTACTLDYDPIICNSKLVSSGITCAYSNECLAAAAGYTTDDFAGQCIFASTIQPGRSIAEPTALSATDGTEAPDTGSAAPVKMVALASALMMAVSALIM